MTKRKRRTRRGAEKYPALRKDLNLRSRTDLIDYDYLDKLSPKELDWLNRFTAEYVGADFRHDRKLHKSKKARRECYNANNARNRCVLTKAKAAGKLSSTDSPRRDDSND